MKLFIIYIVLIILLHFLSLSGRGPNILRHGNRDVYPHQTGPGGHTPYPLLGYRSHVATRAGLPPQRLAVPPTSYHSPECSNGAYHNVSAIISSL